jgi:S1-C subfamily serine protease
LPAGSFFFDDADAISQRAQPDSPIAGFTDYIQTDVSKSGGSVRLGCAAPSNNARRAVDDFIEHGRIVYCWLGVGIEERTGALVVNVHRGSPAARAGVRRGDLITAVEGTDTENIPGL